MFGVVSLRETPEDGGIGNGCFYSPVDVKVFPQSPWSGTLSYISNGLPWMRRGRLPLMKEFVLPRPLTVCEVVMAYGQLHVFLYMGNAPQ